MDDYGDSPDGCGDGDGEHLMTGSWLSGLEGDRWCDLDRITFCPGGDLYRG